MKTIEQVLAEHPFFKGLEPKYLSQLVACASEQNFDAEQIIYREGKPATGFFLVLKGKVGKEMNVPHRGPITVQTISEGEVVGWCWLIPPHNNCFTARAHEATRTVLLDGECLRKLCDEYEQLGYEFYKRFTDVIVTQLQATKLQLMDIYAVQS
jgi:CRP/FNR family cyclic AMP-dependent transcriptional regulator